jgi:uncharacterized membrane protein
MNNPFFAAANFWPYVALVVMSGMAVFVLRRDGLRSLGRVLYVIPMAVFAAEHFTSAQAMAPMVPSYMPWRLFWIYFVGVALMAASLSIMWRIQLRLSATLLGVMLLIFVAMIHLPGTFSPNAPWNIKIIDVREPAFACGAFLLAAAGAPRYTRLLCSLIALSAIFFGVEQFFHPASLPVIPLPKTIPEWMPGGNAWGYLTSVAMVAGGIAMLVPPLTHRAALALGAFVVFLIAVIYLPVMIASRDIVGLNYFTDTMVYAGVLLIAADAQS